MKENIIRYISSSWTRFGKCAFVIDEFAQFGSEDSVKEVLENDLYWFFLQDCLILTDDMKLAMIRKVCVN